jgi:hypothetical protein
LIECLAFYARSKGLAGEDLLHGTHDRAEVRRLCSFACGGELSRRQFGFEPVELGLGGDEVEGWHARRTQDERQQLGRAQLFAFSREEDTYAAECMERQGVRTTPEKPSGENGGEPIT